MLHTIPLHERMLQSLTTIGLVLFDRRDGAWQLSETGEAVCSALASDATSPLDASGWATALKDAMNDHARAMADYTPAVGFSMAKIVP